MTRSRRTGAVLAVGICLVILATVLQTRVAGAQNAPTPPPPPSVPLKIDVVISRHMGDKRLANMPYTLHLNAPGRVGNSAGGSLRLGADVPVGTVSSTKNQEQGTSTTTSTTTNRPEYRYVGIQIDCVVSQTQDGKYEVNVSVNDSSVFAPESSAGLPVRSSDPAAFRTLSFRNTLTFRDGQTLNLISATDRITGELVRIDVTVSVVK